MILMMMVMISLWYKLKVLLMCKSICQYIISIYELFLYVFEFAGE